MNHAPRVALVSLVLAGGLSAHVGAQQDLRPNVPVPFEVRALSDPRAVDQSGRTVIVYELVIANPARDAYTIESLVISDRDGGTITVIEGAKWNDVARGLPPRDDARTVAEAGGLELAGGDRHILYVWIELGERRDPPGELVHHFRVRRGRGENAPSWSVERPRLSVRTDVLVIDAPVRGGRWLVTNGLANDTDHRRFFTAHGEIMISQRFGADFLLLDEGGSNAVGDDGSLLENFFVYDEPLYAVADGTVVTAVSDMDDHGAGVSGVYTWDDVPGNRVVLKIAPEAFVLYPHLKKGAVFVQPGDEVERGQLIGAIGHSGHAQAPHWHFQITDGPHPNLSDGVPFVFREFEVLSEDYTFRDDQRPLPTSGTLHRASLPRIRSVIRFPGER